MMVTYQGSVTRLLVWQSANVRVYALAGLVAVVVYELLQRTIGWSLAVPSLPLAVVGGALGIFVSFRTNSAYARWWEGRQLWGRLVNSSRHWATQVAAYIPDPELRRELIDRQIGYVHVLRCVLRQQPPLADASVVRALSAADQEALAGQSNLCHALELTPITFSIFFLQSFAIANSSSCRNYLNFYDFTDNFKVHRAISSFMEIEGVVTSSESI